MKHVAKGTEGSERALSVRVEARRQQALDDQVDIVFVDLDMLVMDGLAAAEEVERKGIPVILVSGHPDSESVVIDQEPVVTRISKPASLESVQRAIEQALAARR